MKTSGAGGRAGGAGGGTPSEQAMGRSANGVKSTPLTKAERDALDRLSGPEFLGVNNHFRGVARFSADRVADIKAHASILDSAIRKGGLARSTTLYRGTDWKALGLTSAPRKGQVLSHDKGYQSTSRSRDVAKGFSRGVTMVIRARKGARAADVSHHTGGREREVLLPRNTRYRVRSVRTDKSGHSTVHVDLVD